MSSLKRKAESTIPTGIDTKKPKQASMESFFGPPKVTVTKPTPVSEATYLGSGPNPSSTATTNVNVGGSKDVGDKVNFEAMTPIAQATAIKFDKEKWIASLTNEQKELLKLECETLDESWLAQLKDEVTSKEFLDLKRFLRKEVAAGKEIYPPMEDVYSWSRHTPLSTVRAVILGQDPYHNTNQAHGLCFSVRPPTPAPPSLKNIYTCLKRDYPAFNPPPNRGGLLTPWAQSGVLLLNTVLTVRAHEANSHANRGWERFTQKCIDIVAKVRGKGVVFLAWGTPAGKRVVRVNRTKHLVLQSVHPSPLSASRGFFECGHFKKTNEWLRERYGIEGEIDWQLDGKKVVEKAVEKIMEKTTTDEKTTEKEGDI